MEMMVNLLRSGPSSSLWSSLALWILNLPAMIFPGHPKYARDLTQPTGQKLNKLRGSH